MKLHIHEEVLPEIKTTHFNDALFSLPERYSLRLKQYISIAMGKFFQD